MAEGVYPIIVAFIGIAIMLGIGTQVLGNTTMDCTNLPGYNDGVVSGITVTAGGTNYTSNPTVTISGGGGTGATATAARTGTAVSSVTVTNEGSGYTSQPTVSFSHVNGTGAAANAQIDTASTGWALACQNGNESTQNAYALLIIILIVVAAVAILFVIRML